MQHAKQHTCTAAIAVGHNFHSSGDKFKAFLQSVFPPWLEAAVIIISHQGLLSLCRSASGFSSSLNFVNDQT
jgi:hypothetical protein